MTATRMKLVFCILFGLCSAVTAIRQFQVRFVAQGGSNYAHAGRVDVYIDGSWGTICASDWDINDAEVVCKEMGKGYAKTVSVTGTLPSGSGTKCLSSVRCYGHESLLSECTVTKRTRSNSRNDKGIVCYPPPSEAGIKLANGPDQYSGWVEVKLASGSWSSLHYWYWSTSTWAYRQKPASICRQLGFGELNWWEVHTWHSSISMTHVRNCAYGIADHRTCTLSSTTSVHYAFVGCHKPGSIPCSAPYIPSHAFVTNPRLNYDFGDRVTVTCNTTSQTFNIQCHNKGLWSGPAVVCPASTALGMPAGPSKCSAPSIPRYSAIDNLRLNYNHGERVTVRCDNTIIQPFYLHCEDTGLWTGSLQSCPAPVVAPARCSPPYVPRYASVDNIRLEYNSGESITVTCDSRTDGSYALQCNSEGFWTGTVLSCPQPTEDPEKCSAPYVPRYASIQNLQLNYNYGDSITVACANSSTQFTLQCHTNGRWRGQVVSCPEPTEAPIPCDAPYLPKYASVQGLRLNYNYGDSLTVTCETSNSRFTLRCSSQGLWSGPNLSCPEPTETPEQCSAPYVPRHASIQDLRLNYNHGDRITVTCDSSSARFSLQCDTSGKWSGQVVSCPAPIEDPEKCSAPYVPRYASIQNLQLNYNFGDSITVACANSSTQFTLQCHTNGRWRGQVVSCPEPTEVPPQCSAPAIPKHSSIQAFQMTYSYGDSVTVTCDVSNSRFTLQCNNKGLWSGADISCPEPTVAPVRCSPPYVPRYASLDNESLVYNLRDSVTVTCDGAAERSYTLQCNTEGFWTGRPLSCPELRAAAAVTPRHAYCSAPALPHNSAIQNLRLSYKDGDIINVTCNEDHSIWFDLSCDDGMWRGQNVVCPDPVTACNPPIIPAVSSVKNLKPRYKIGDEVNITCNIGSDWLIWECHNDGLWRGRAVNCEVTADSQEVRSGKITSGEKPDGQNVFITGLLVAAVIMFVLVLMSMVAFSISIKGHCSGSPKDRLKEMKADRGPLPDVPDGYEDFIVGSKSIYTEPYLKAKELSQAYETYEKPY